MSRDLGMGMFLTVVPQLLLISIPHLPAPHMLSLVVVGFPLPPPHCYIPPPPPCCVAPFFIVVLLLSPSSSCHFLVGLMPCTCHQWATFIGFERSGIWARVVLPLPNPSCWCWAYLFIIKSVAIVKFVIVVKSMDIVKSLAVVESVDVVESVAIVGSVDIVESVAVVKSMDVVESVAAVESMATVKSIMLRVQVGLSRKWEGHWSWESVGLGISEVVEEGKMKMNYDFGMVCFLRCTLWPLCVLPHPSLIPLSIQIGAHPFRRGGIHTLMCCEDQPTSPTWWRGVILVDSLCHLLSSSLCIPSPLPLCCVISPSSPSLFPPPPPRHLPPPLPSLTAFACIHFLAVKLGCCLLRSHCCWSLCWGSWVLSAALRISPHHLQGGGAWSRVDICPHPSMEGRGQDGGGSGNKSGSDNKGGGSNNEGSGGGWKSMLIFVQQYLGSTQLAGKPGPHLCLSSRSLLPMARRA